MEAHWVNRDQRFNDFNTAYEHYRIAIPGSLDGKHHAAIINENVKIAIPSPFNGTHQVANNHAALQIESTNRDPNHSGEHGERWYENEVRLNRINKTIVFLFGCSIFVCIMLLPLWLHILANRAPYYLEKYGNYKIQMKTKEYGIEFYVKSADAFNKKYPDGTPARAQIENTIITEYIQKEQEACSWDLWYHSTDINYPTRECDKLQSMGIPISN